MIIMIAIIKDKSKIVGFRLLDTHEHKTMEATYQSVVNALNNNITSMPNLDITNGKLRIKQGSMEGYTLINKQLQLLNKPSMVILGKTPNKTYICSDYKGNIREIDQKNIVKYQLANAAEPKNKAIENYNAKALLMGHSELSFRVDGKEIHLVGVPEKTKNCIIPNFVTKIDSRAFLNCDNIQTITIPNSVTEIGEEAFWRCSSLQTITIPSSIREIGEGAFLECSSLKTVIIPDSVKELGAGAFSGCKSLRAVNIPNSIKELGNWTFGECHSLTEISIPSSIIEIGTGAFYECLALKQIDIPNSVTKIGNEAFDGCNNLIKIRIPKRLKEYINHLDCKIETY